MSKYTHYTEAQKEQARTTDIVDLLRRQGEKVRRAGSEYEWMDGYEKVSIKGNLWYHQYEETGGNTIDFVQRFMDKTYPEAMEFLLGGSLGTLSTSPPIERRPPVPLELPKRNDNMRRAYALEVHQQCSRYTTRRTTSSATSASAKLMHSPQAENTPL